MNPNWDVRYSVEGGGGVVNVRCIVFYCKARQSLAKKLLVHDKITTYVKQLRLLGVRLQNSHFFPKSVKKSVKRGVRVFRVRSARASHVLQACEAREKKTTVGFPYNEFVPTKGFKMSSRCQKSVHNSALFVNLIHSVIDFEGE